MSAHAALKSATAAAHDRLDARFSHYNLSDDADYGRFLTAHAAALLPIEEALQAAGADRIDATWTKARRSFALREDLAAMGLSLPVPVAPPAFANDAEIIGGLYVLEGSRLGAKMLRRSLRSDQPQAFLSHRGEKRWAEIVALIERNLATHVDRQYAEAAAVETFACFAAAVECVGGE